MGPSARSLLVWGWGQLASGDRRGWLGPPAQVASLALLALAAATLGNGEGVELVFLAGAAVLGAWAAVAIHAHRRAARRRAALDLPSGESGAGDLLWLAPIAIGLATALWLAGGRAGDPGMVLDDYLADWRAGRAEAAIGRFVTPPGTVAAMTAAWEGQLAGLRNDLVRLAAEHGPDAGIDPDRPIDTVRWADGGPVDGGAGYLVVIEVVRRESVRGQLFGILPTTSQRLVTIARLGEVRLRLEPTAGSGDAWRIVRVEVGGVALGG